MHKNRAEVMDYIISRIEFVLEKIKWDENLKATRNFLSLAKANAEHERSKYLTEKI